MLMKKIVSFSMVCVLFSGLLTGCIFTEAKEYGLDKKEPVEITLWNYYSSAQAVAFEEMVQEFNATVGMEKGIIVNSQSKESIDDLISALEKSVNKEVGAEEMPDIFQCYLDLAVSLNDKELLADLGQYITEEEKAEYIGSYIEEGSSFKDGKWKLFPIAKANELLVVNKTVWDTFSAETGVKKEQLLTWEGITELGEEYYDWSKGKSFFGRDAFANYMIVGSKQLGKDLMTIEDGNVTLEMDKKILKKLWDNFYVPYVKGYFNHTGRYRSDDMKTGTIIASVGSTSGISFFSEEVVVDDMESYPVEYMVLPVPNFAGKESYVAQQGASMAVTKGTKKEEYASTVFLKWFTEEERNINFSIESGYLPVKKEASDIGNIKEYIKKRGIELRPIQEAAIEVSNEQVLNSNLYITKGFSNGEKVRNILNSTMVETAMSNAENIRKAVSQGTAREEAIAEYLSEEHFEQWYEDTKGQIEKVCGE